VPQLQEQAPLLVARELQAPLAAGEQLWRQLL
jgi:hypothetical protein